MHAYISLEKIY